MNFVPPPTATPEKPAFVRMASLVKPYSGTFAARPSRTTCASSAFTTAKPFGGCVAKMRAFARPYSSLRGVAIEVIGREVQNRGALKRRVD
jgi:hypothetical protein